MLDELLKLPPKERRKIVRKIKPATRKHLFFNKMTLTKVLNLDEIKDYEERVRLRSEYITASPEEIHWDWAEFQSTTGELIKSNTLLVSTNGESIGYTIDGRLRFNSAITSGKNEYRHLRINGLLRVIHRVVSSTFIPKPERHSALSYELLQTNHIDGIKYHNYISNLEWCTNQENQRHQYGHDKYTEEENFIFEVLADNGYKGVKFTLSASEAISFGLVYDNLRRTALKKDLFSTGRLYGFKIDFSKENNLPMPSEIKDLYLKDKSYFNPFVKPVLGVVKSGAHSGFKFSLVGDNDYKLFSKSAVSRVANRKLPHHKNCTFKFISLKEAIPLHRPYPPR